MIGSSSTEEDGAVVAPLTSGAAMTETTSKKICVEEVYVDRLNIWSAQSASLKSNGKINPTLILSNIQLFLRSACHVIN